MAGGMTNSRCYSLFAVFGAVLSLPRPQPRDGTRGLALFAWLG